MGLDDGRLNGDIKESFGCKLLGSGRRARVEIDKGGGGFHMLEASKVKI